MVMIIIKRFISTSSSLQYAGKIWRQKHGLPKLQTALTALIDIPDYSFLDGRPVPLSAGQRRRKEDQERLCKQAIEGLNFIEKGKSNRDEYREKIILDTKEGSGRRLKAKEFIRK